MKNGSKGGGETPKGVEMEHSQVAWRAAYCPHLPRLQVLHASSHLVSAGDQRGEGQWPLAAPRPIRAEVRAGGAPGPQELPQIALRSTFHNHV